MSFGPEDLASALGGGEHRCIIPITHDRLHECHYWWHEVARNYHEPAEFRWSLGAFLQGARSLTLMIQVEKRVFDRMDWYESWVERAKKSKVLTWVNRARVHVVHQGVLEPSSWAELRCLFPDDDPRKMAIEDLEEEDEDGPAQFRANPFLCTHVLMGKPLPDEDHPHEVERHWELADLPGREVLDLCAEVYGELAALVRLAHLHAGQAMRVESRTFGAMGREPGRLPCMDDTSKFRVAYFVPTPDGYTWVDEPPGLHSG